MDRKRSAWPAKLRGGIALAALASAACIEIPWTKSYEERIASAELDLATWSAHPCGDLDGDGIDELVVHADASGDPDRFELVAWVVSGRDLAVRFRVRHLGRTDAATPFGALPAGDLDGDGRPDLVVAEYGPEAARGARAPRVLGAISGRDGAPIRGDAGPSLPADQRVDPSSLFEAHVVEVAGPDEWEHHESFAERLVAPGQHALDAGALYLCGDVDADGAVDALTFGRRPARVRVVSAASGTVSCDRKLADARYATHAVAMLPLGDVDGDGTRDRLVGAQVSTSRERTSPRRCELALMTIVSGSSGAALHTLDRAALLASAAD